MPSQQSCTAMDRATRSVVVIGAGHRRAGGCALAGACRGRGDSARAPGAMPAARCARCHPGGAVDAGPTVLTLRRVFDALFADVGARLEDHVELVAEPHPGAPLLAGRRPARPLRRPDAQRRSAIARLCRRDRRARIRRFLPRAARGCSTAFEAPDDAARSAPSDARPVPRVCCATLALLARHGAACEARRSARAQLLGPAAAAAVRPLRHLCRRLAVALSGPAGADLARPRRAASGGCAGGMHRLADALARLAAAHGADVPLRHARRRGSRRRRGRVAGRGAGRRHCLPAGTSSSTAIPARWRRGCWGPTATDGRAADGKARRAACRPMSGPSPRAARGRNWRITTSSSAPTRRRIR